MKYLIDTDWVIDHFNNVKETTKKLEELAPEGMAIRIVSLAELYEGIYYSKNPVKSQQLLEEFLVPDLKVLNIDEDVCKIFGKERGKLRKQGRIISDFDLLISATCLYYNLTLLTNNLRHYERIEGLKILSIS